MTIEVVLLALASTVRPTSLAAVYALVSGDSPRRLMIVYIAAGSRHDRLRTAGDLGVQRG